VCRRYLRLGAGGSYHFHARIKVRYYIFVFYEYFSLLIPNNKFRTSQQASPLTSDLQSRQVPNSPNNAYICCLQFASLGTKYYRTVEDLPNAHVHSEDLGHTLAFQVSRILDVRWVPANVGLAPLPRAFEAPSHLRSSDLGCLFLL
jgi:hypothetical protein